MEDKYSGAADKVTVQFTMTIAERELIKKHGARIGLNVSQFCKTVVFARINNYPLKDEKTNIAKKEPEVK